MADLLPQREAIMQALDRLLAWDEIARSPQLRNFLDYIVRRTLDGDEQSIKAYSIAVDVFGRGAEFDPQADPIVRVQARRLRSLLDDYYRGPGLGEVIQIRLPVGRYVPDFAALAEPDPIRDETPAAVAGAKGRPAGFARSWLAVAAIAGVAAVAALGLSMWAPPVQTAGPVASQRPTITIVEFQNLATTANPAPQVAGLAIELVTDLDEFGDIGTHYGGGGQGGAASADLPASDFILTGIVRADETEVQYSAILTDTDNGNVVWNHALAVPLDEASSPAVLDRVSRSLSLTLGSPRGPLHVAARVMLAQDSADAPVSLYLCRVRFDLYRENGSARDAGRASDCYAALSEADQGTAEALAARSILSAEGADAGKAGDMGGVRSARGGMDAAAAGLDSAIGLDPISGFIWEQRARLHEAQGALAQARGDFRSAVQLNPANTDSSAAFARLLAFDGSLGDAEPLALEAVNGSPNPPSWYFGVPALLALRDGDNLGAMEAAERYAQADREIGPVLAIVAAQAAGDGAVVNRYLPEVLDLPSFRALGVLPRLRQRISDPVLVDRIGTALEQAGVPLAALSETF